ncbi:hypothetical protein BJ741DRAFT_114551 [Chytriomyces cf. hyalinus JEL632]|nr:hypothetical protein BJ741DRAFT_114551 [Chytriomyces cf. hyalinus JEL632]
MLSSSIERTAAKATTDQERRFAKERRDLREVERKAAVAVQNLARRQKQLEAQLFSLSLADEALMLKRNKSKTPKPNVLPNQTPTPPTAARRKLKKKVVKKTADASNEAHEKCIQIPIATHSSVTSASPSRLQRFVVPHGECHVSYVDIGLGDSYHQSVVGDPPLALNVSHASISSVQDHKEYRKMIIRFLRNLESEDTVTEMFLELSGDDEDLPRDWKQQSLQFGGKLKGKIGELVLLYNEYFSKMENVTQDAGH